MFFKKMNKLTEEANEIRRESDKELSLNLSKLTNVIEEKENNTQSIERLSKQNQKLKEELRSAEDVIQIITSRGNVQFNPHDNNITLIFEIDRDIRFKLQRIGGMNISNMTEAFLASAEALAREERKERGQND